MGKGGGKKIAVVKLFEATDLHQLIEDGLVQTSLKKKDIAKTSLVYHSETVAGLSLELSGSKIKYNDKKGEFTGGTITDFVFRLGDDVIATFTGVKIPIAKLSVAAEKAAEGKWNPLDKLFNATALKIVGSDFDDVLTGSKHADKIYGEGGDDLLTGEKGKDLLDGGDGLADGVDYGAEGGKKGVVVNLTTGKATDTYGNKDTLANIEEVYGTNKDDRITGNDADNYFELGKGDDIVDGKGGSFNMVSYFWETGGAGIFVDLAAGTATDTYGDTDTLSNIQIIRGTQQDDVILGDDADNIFRGMAGDDSFDGRGGVDEIRYERDASYGGDAGVYVNLEDGVAIDGFGNNDSFTRIEWVMGTAFDDELIGDAAANRLRGLGGADWFTGGAGDDVIDGGPNADEADLVDYSAETGGAGVAVDLAAGTATDTFGDADTLISIEEVIGTLFDDVIVGNDVDNFFVLGAGDDSVDGGAGDFDQVSYGEETGGSGIVVDLAAGTATDTWGDADTLVSIEAIRGSQWDDQISGSDADNSFRGMQGDDTMDGGNGTDEVRYDRDASRGGTAGVTVDLGAGTATDGFGDADTLVSIERVRGTEVADILIGSDGDNRLEGLGGDDILTGGLGDDQFRIRSADLGTDTITDFEQDADAVMLDFISDFSQLTITEFGDHAIVAAAGGFELRVEGEFTGLSADDFILLA